MRTRMLFCVMVACLAISGCGGGQTNNERVQARSVLRPLPSSTPGMRRFEFASSCFNYPDGEKGRMKNLKEWLALNGITDYKITHKVHLVTDKVLGTVKGEVYYTIEAKANE